jgi:ParB-like chromosome segregation protein Spo0J
LTLQEDSPAGSCVSEWLTYGHTEIECQPVEQIAVGSLSTAGSPRILGVDLEHAELLAVTPGDLPPIIVHRETMRVIDGAHRLLAAQLRGQRQIAAQFFSGDERDAFIVAVRANISHGLPLSLADRKAAAARIVESHPQWSDRMVASIVGLAARTVAEIRGKNADPAAGSTVRVGRDGRLRPTNGAEGRLRASELISSQPDLSLRQIAQAAGISPETARDVRNRMRRGEDPLARRQERDRERDRVARPGVAGPGPASRRPGTGDMRILGRTRADVISRLKADPALRFSETGRILLRLLHIHLVETDEWERVGDNIPPHCSSIVADLAKGCAQMWHEFAERVERKVTDAAASAPGS